MTESEAFKAWAKDYFAGPQRDIACLAWQAATAAERERYAKVCDAICAEHWSLYKGMPPNEQHPARGNQYTEGVSDGAALCAEAIRRTP